VVAEGFSATRPEETGTWLRDLAARLAHRGHRVTAVLSCLEDVDSPDDDPPGVTVWRAGAADPEPLLEQALAQQPDVVHLASPGPWSADAVRALAAAPLVLDAHDFWPVCAAGDLVQRPALRPCPHHHPFAHCGSCAGLLHLRAMEERESLGREARIVIAHTAAARDRLEAGLGRTVELVRPGVDPFVFTPSPDEPLAPEVAALAATPHPLRVLVLGDGGQHRGALALADLLVALHARVPGVEMVLVEDGADDSGRAQILLAEAREMGLVAQVIVFRGVSPTDAPALFAACDVACLPGPLPASGGLRVMQALSAGLPVVAHDGGAVAELVHNGAEGLVLPADPIGGFAHAVAALLRDPAGRSAYAERARLAAMERFDVDRAVHAHEEFYFRARRRESHRRAA
jgi:glycosyltransferase involved in cell wall biosynthesis